jgi:hypothetical protein
MASDVKTMTLRFSPEKHEKLVKLKEKSGAKSWEEWIQKIAGTEERKKNSCLQSTCDGQCELYPKPCGDGQ